VTYRLTFYLVHLNNTINNLIHKRIVIGSDRRLETKQGIEGKIVRFRSGRVENRVRVKDNDRRSEPDRRSEAINFGTC